MSHDGVLNFDKPLGLTSARALDRVRRITGQRKSGHAGALDPLADGVLVVCLGAATKLVEAWMDQPKVYRATGRLDATNETLDAESPPQPVPVPHVPTAGDVAEAARALEGLIQQTPPARSALKVRGQPAYLLARAGRAPELAARPVRVYWLHVARYAWPEVEFEVACGRGTYVRALIRDLGAKLGVGGYLTALRRLAVGPLHVERAWTLERLEHAPAAEWLWPLAEARVALAAPPTVPPRPA